MSDNANNDLELGKLIKGVETLTAEVNKLRTNFEELQQKVHTGKGIFYGALMVAGSAGAGLTKIIDYISS